MVRKNYTTNLTSLSIPIKVNGKDKRIYFAKGYRVGNYIVHSHYSTCNKEEQDAIESSRLFGMNIKIDLEEIIPDKAASIIEPSEVDVQPLIETKTAFDHVITTKDAIALLTASPFNLKVLQCNSKPKIQNRIKELGISFPNISYDL